MAFLGIKTSGFQAGLLAAMDSQVLADWPR